MKPDKYTRTLVVTSRRLEEKELQDAFRGNKGTPWFRALVQIIEDDKHQQTLNAASHANQNNTLGMAADFGAYEVLAGLLNTITNHAESEG